MQIDRSIKLSTELLVFRGAGGQCHESSDIRSRVTRALTLEEPHEATNTSPILGLWFSGSPGLRVSGPSVRRSGGPANRFGVVTFSLNGQCLTIQSDGV